MKNSKISKQHLELLIKICKQKATEKDLKNYIEELLRENILDASSLPILNFSHIKKSRTYGDYSVEKRTITIYRNSIDDVLENKNNIVSLISTFGHEFGHHLQTLMDPNNAHNEQEKEYSILMQDIYDNIEYYKGRTTLSLDLLSKKNNQKILSQFLSDYFPNSAIKKWYDNLDEDVRDDLLENLEYSKYAQFNCEEDARERGVYYVTKLIEIYLSDERIQSNKELYNWIELLSNSTQNITDQNRNIFSDNNLPNLVQENIEIKAYYNDYKNLKYAIDTEVDYNFLRKIANILFKEKNQEKKLVIDAFLEVLTNEYVLKRINKSSAKKDVIKCAETIFEQKNNNAEKILASNIIRNILIESNKEFSEYTLSKLLNIYSGYKNSHVFGKEDGFLLYFASSDYNCYYKVKNLIKSLYSENRIKEICDMMDYNIVCEYAEERYDYGGDFYYLFDSLMKYKVKALKDYNNQQSVDEKSDNVNYLLNQTKKLLREYNIREEVYKRSLAKDDDFFVEDEKNKRKILSNKMMESWGVNKTEIESSIKKLESMNLSTLFHE